MLGLDAADGAARRTDDPGHAHLRVDGDTHLAGAAGQLHGRPARVEPAIARQVHGAVETLAGHVGEDAQRFRGRDRVHVEADGLRHADLPLEEPLLIAARGDAQAADLVPVLHGIRLRLEFPVEADAVLPHPHQRRRGVEVRHHPGGVPGGAAGQRALVHERHVRPTLAGEVIGDAASGDAAPDDDDPGAILPPPQGC